MSKARARRKMSLDRGYVPTKRQREIEEAFFKRGGRHPFYMSHIAADSGLRESWEHRKFTKQRMARRLHVSPRGTYFWLAGLDPLAGCYLRADGSTQAFYGPWQPPLTCIGCGGNLLLPNTAIITSFRAPAHLLSLLVEEISSCTNGQDHYELVMIPGLTTVPPCSSAPCRSISPPSRGQSPPT